MTFIQEIAELHRQADAVREAREFIEATHIIKRGIDVYQEPTELDECCSVCGEVCETTISTFTKQIHIHQRCLESERVK